MRVNGRTCTFPVKARCPNVGECQNRRQEWVGRRRSTRREAGGDGTGGFWGVGEKLGKGRTFEIKKNIKTKQSKATKQTNKELREHQERG